jgi:hypothetical protein
MLEERKSRRCDEKLERRRKSFSHHAGVRVVPPVRRKLIYYFSLSSEIIHLLPFRDYTFPSLPPALKFVLDEILDRKASPPSSNRNEVN